MDDHIKLSYYYYNNIPAHSRDVDSTRYRFLSIDANSYQRDWYSPVNTRIPQQPPQQQLAPPPTLPAPQQHHPGYNSYPPLYGSVDPRLDSAHGRYKPAYSASQQFGLPYPSTAPYPLPYPPVYTRDALPAATHTLHITASSPSQHLPPPHLPAVESAPPAFPELPPPPAYSSVFNSPTYPEMKYPQLSSPMVAPAFVQNEMVVCYFFSSPLLIFHCLLFPKFEDQG